MSLSKSTKQQPNSALKQLDESQWSWSHWRAVMVGGTGFLTDSYDNFVIGLMVPMIAYVYYPGSHGRLPSLEDGLIKASSAYGNLIGQFTFGILGDVFGRKKVYGMELIILIVGALGSALVGAPVRGISFIAILGFWRFILGVGVGGDYPVSGVIASEFASVKNRGFMVALVFAMQGVGILLGAIVAVVVLLIFKTSIEEDVMNLDICWRILAGFGIVPALLAVYFRLHIPETPRFTIDVDGDAEKGLADAQKYLNDDGAKSPANNAPVPAAKPKQPTTDSPFGTYFKRFTAYFGKWVNLKVLIATSMCCSIGYADSSTPFKHVWTEAIGALIIACAGNVPGYFFTVYFVDKWGRKPIQFMGFAVLFVCFTTLSAAYWYLKREAIPLFIVIYAMTQFFFNFGPNATTFIVPAEAFPTHVRATAHGISAAAGKLGAIIAAQGFSKLVNIGGPGQFMPGVLALFAACCAGGFLFTFWIPETKGKSLEEISEVREN